MPNDVLLVFLSLDLTKLAPYSSIFFANSGQFFINWLGYYGGAFPSKRKLVLLYAFFVTEERLLSKPRNFNSPLDSLLSKYVLQDSNFFWKT